MNRLLDIGPIIQARGDGFAYPKHNIRIRCDCGGRLEREQMDLAYCERCGAEYVIWNHQKRRVPA